MKLLSTVFKTEHIDVQLLLDKSRTDLAPEYEFTKRYEIKVSFPTLNIKFWLKVIDLRISVDPPEAGILGIELTSRFTKPRSAQKGLFTATKPEPENLLLTVGKIKKMLGEENVGVPELLDKRLPKAFTLNHRKLPSGVEKVIEKPSEADVKIVLNYFDPPLAADVSVNQKRLIYLRTSFFSGAVKEYSGVWKSSSYWWNRFSWKSEEWM